MRPWAPAQEESCLGPDGCDPALTIRSSPLGGPGSLRSGQQGPCDKRTGCLFTSLAGRADEITTSRVQDGGARYNTSYIQGVGLGTITDAMTAIKYAVFDKKRLSM